MWKITHASFDSGFTNWSRPRNREEALEEFEKLKKSGWIGLFSLYSPSGKLTDRHYNSKRKDSD